MAEHVTEPVMGLFDIDRFNESNALCRRGEGCKRDGPIHRLYKQDMAAISKIWPHWALRRWWVPKWRVLDSSWWAGTCHFH